MNKKFALSLLFVFMCVGFLVTGCETISVATKITADTSSVVVRLSDDDGEGVGTGTFTISCDNFENSHIAFNAENPEKIKIKYDRNYSNYKVTVTGLTAGTTKVIAYLVENNKVKTEVDVSVIQSIKTLTSVPNYIHYLAIGEKSFIRPNDSLTIQPIDGYLNDIRYSVLEDGEALGVTIDEKTGLIDATNVTSAGIVTIRASVEGSFADITVKLVKPVDATSVIITKEMQDGSSLTIYENGELLVGDMITMVKTIDLYSSFNLVFDYDETLVGQNLTAVVVGNSITCKKISNEKLSVSAVGLNTSTLKLSFNIAGAEDFIEPIEIELFVKVIDSPFDINVNGESSNENDGVFEKIIYNRYASGIYGLEMEFSLSPSSVLDENSVIELEFSDRTKVQNELLILDSRGDRLGVTTSADGTVTSFSNFTIKAREKIYFRSLLDMVPSNTVYTFTATSRISRTYNDGKVVKATINLRVLEGVASLIAEQDTYYIERGEDIDDGEVVEISTGNVSGDTSSITYSIEDESVVKVVKQDDLTYHVYGLKNGSTTITFDSGNGYTLPINITVFGKLEWARITCESEFENDNIGQVKYDKDNSLSVVSVRTGGSFDIDIITNDGASIYEITTPLLNSNVQLEYLNESKTKVRITVPIEGKFTLSFVLFGYDSSSYGKVDESEAIRPGRIEIDSYIPVSGIVMNYSSLTLMDRSTVSTTSFENECQANLSLSIYPSNAKIEEKDIQWSIGVGSEGNGVLSNDTGRTTVFTAGTLDNDYFDNGATVTVVAYLTDRGRSYTASCEILIKKAVMVNSIKLVNVFNGDLYFDARNGLVEFDEEGNPIATDNFFNVVANAYPEDAHNRNLRYIYIQDDADSNALPVFSVSSTGKVMPIRGGTAILRVVAEDGFVDLDNVKVYRDIRVVVADGSSVETAYRIANADELISIGLNSTSMNLYYVLANDIDLSSIANWSPIGSIDLPFTGYLSGRYSIGIDNFEIVSKITGLRINCKLDGDSDVYLGLFGCVNFGQIVDLKVECAEMVVDASELNGDLYFGLIAGKVQSVLNASPDEDFEAKNTFIKNCSVKGLSANSEKYTVSIGGKSSYIGGMLGFVEGDVEITFGDEVAVELPYLSVTDEMNYGVNSLYVGGFAGYVKSVIDVIDSCYINGFSNANIVGSFNNYGSIYNGNIIYQAYFVGAGLDVIIGDLKVAEDVYSQIAVGGLIGQTEIKIVDISNTESAGTIINSEEEKDDLFVVKNVGVSANISAENCENVGGLIGCNGYILSNVYFTGSVYGKDNVGGICGFSSALVDRAIVEDSGNYVVKGYSDVGGIVGEQNGESKAYVIYLDSSKENSVGFSINNAIQFSYISSANENNIIFGTADLGDINVGNIVGSITNGLVLGCYSDINSSSSLLIGNSNASIIAFCFVVGGNLGSGVPQYSYEVGRGEVASYDEANMLNATYNGSALWLKPGTFIDVNGDIVHIAGNVNNGNLIIRRPNELPLFSVLYDSMNVTIKDKGDNFIKVDEDKAILFYYELDEAFESSLEVSVKYQIRQEVKELNVINLQDILDVDVSPTPFTNIRVNVEAKDSAGNPSRIVNINSNGTLTICGEGLVFLTITSKVNPNLSKVVQLYITNYVSAFKLFAGTNASGIEYNNDAVISVRKDYKVDLYAEILSEYKGYVFKKSDNLGLSLQIQANDENIEIEETSGYYVAINDMVYEAVEVGGKFVFAELDNAELKQMNEDDVVQLYIEYQDTIYNVFKTSYISYFDYSQFAINNYSCDATYYVSIDGVKYYGEFSSGDLLFKDLGMYAQKIPSDGRAGYRLICNGKCYPIYIDKIYLDIDSVNTVSLEGFEAYRNTIVMKAYFSTQFRNESNEITSQKVFATTNLINYKSFILNVFEGAISIDGSIDGVVYNPSDSISFEITLVSDSANDELELSAVGDELSVVLEKKDVFALANGTYRIIYSVNVSLENTFDARYFSQNKIFDLVFTSKLLSDMSKTISVEFEPQKVQKINITNYTNGEIIYSSDLDGYVYNPNEVPSLYIANNATGMININMYPYYSNIDMVTVESVSVNGEKVTLIQAVADLTGNATGYFSDITPRSQYSSDGTSLILQKYSTISGDLKQFDGNFYLRTLISSSVKENTIMPIIVKAYYYDENGVPVLAKQEILNLIVKEIPFIKIELADSMVSNYVVRGTTAGVVVTMGRAFAGQSYEGVATLLNFNADGSNKLVSELQGVSYRHSNKYTVVDGREVYNDVIYVGIGIPSGTEIRIDVRVVYDENGISKVVYSYLTLIVVDFMVEDVDLYSFNNETNYLRMNLLENYKLGVDNIYFNVAPTFDVARRNYLEIGLDSEYLYNGYLYGMIEENCEDGRVYYLTKTGNIYYIRDVNGQIMFGGQAFIYNKKDSVKYPGELVTTDSGTPLEMFVGEQGFTYISGIEYKLREFKNAVEFDYKNFTRKVSEDTYASIDTEVNPDSKFYIKENEKGEPYLVGVSVGSNFGLRFTLKYGFDVDNDYAVVVYSGDSNPGEYVVYQDNYTFNIVTYSEIDLPLPIYAQSDLENMTEGEHYILMNDITLVNFKPIDVAFASLDGNGYSLILKSFDIEGISTTESIDLGVFAVIPENSVVKNLTINISKLTTLDLSDYTTINIGLFAISNNGIITNGCIAYSDPAFESPNVVTETTVNGLTVVTMDGATKLEIKTSRFNGEETTLNFAGFVYANSGDITNSRVGGVDDNAYLQVNARGNIAGFSILNSGHISSSFVRNIYMRNTNVSATNSKTAGFVSMNRGHISASYVKGGYSINRPIRADYGAIISNGSVGGFVYENGGEIADSYSNIIISSNARVGGFVFSNTEKGTIKSSYSASTILKNSALHMPFVGVDAKSIIQNENPDGLSNCYYLEEDGESYESVSLGEGVYPVNISNFDQEIEFNDFSFGNRLYSSVWTMEMGYPELVSANEIAFSQRNMNMINDKEFIYTYSSDMLGTENNPYLITSAEDFNYWFNYDALGGGSKVVSNKYFRIVSDINFDDVAGDNTTKDIMLCATTIDGNNFSLSNIRINSYAEDSERLSIGLFKKIYGHNVENIGISDSEKRSGYSTIKNIKLNVKEANALNVSYLGALAGIVQDTNLLNIDVSSNQVMQAYNVVGGIAGIISGNSSIMRVNSSASVQAVYKSSEKLDKPLIYDREENVRQISHAGAVAGIVDIDANISYDELREVSSANIKYVKVVGSGTVSAEYAGGLFGYLGEGSSAYDVYYELNYNDTENKQHISTTYCAGGIVGVNYGLINHARIKHSDKEQALVDNAISSYLTSLSSGSFGKTNLFNGYIWCAGGLVGINYGGLITNSYSRVDVVDSNIKGDTGIVTEQYFGGLVGITYSGDITNSYASGNVVTKVSNNSYGGGLIGRLSYILGKVNQEEGESFNKNELQLKNLYAVNYWDKDLAKMAFRVGTDNAHYTGVFIGYASPLDNSSQIVASVSNLYAINQVVFNEGSSRSVALFSPVGDIPYVKVAKNDVNKLGFGNGLETSIENNAQGENIFSLNTIFKTDSISVADSNSFFNPLLSVDNGKIWSMESGCYPVLRLGNYVDETTITTAKQLITAMNDSPYKTFRIANDLDFYGIDTFVTKTFTGKLLSAKVATSGAEKGKTIPVNFYNIDLSKLFNSGYVENVGFMAFTKRATISNINFYVKGFETTDDKRVDRFGIISAQDEGSYFNNINVFIVTASQITKGNVKTLSLGQIDVNSVKTGGFIGEASGNVVLNACNFAGQLVVNNTRASDLKVYLGGFIGSSQLVKLYSSANLGHFSYSSLVQFGTYSYDEINHKYTFVCDANGEVLVSSIPSGKSAIKLESADNSIDDIEVYVGGIIGASDEMLIASNVKISNVHADGNNVDVVVNLSANDGKKTTARVGGFAGYANSAQLKNIYIKTNVAVNGGMYDYVGGFLGRAIDLVALNIRVGEPDNYSGVSVKNVKTLGCVGGLLGYATTVNMNSGSANQSVVYADIDVTTKNASKLAVGGAYGQYEGVSATEQNGLLTFGNITVGSTTLSNSADYVYVGGIIGSNVVMYEPDIEEKIQADTTLQNSYSGMNITAKAQKYAYVGGLIGSANSSNIQRNLNGGNQVADDNLNGSLFIDNCTISGYIDVYNNASVDSLYVGGVAGYNAKNNTIKDVLVLATLVRPSYGNADKNCYSYEIFANGNLTYAGSNYYSDEVAGYTYEDMSYIRGATTSKNLSDSVKCLQYGELLNALSTGNIENGAYKLAIKLVETSLGSVFNPIKVGTGSDISSDEKAYQILMNDITVNSSKSVNGVFAGNGKQITANTTIFTIIDKYAVVGNFAITTASEISGAVLANENYGIIHDIYAIGTISGNTGDYNNCSICGGVGTSNGHHELQIISEEESPFDFVYQETQCIYCGEVFDREAKADGSFDYSCGYDPETVECENHKNDCDVCGGTGLGSYNDGYVLDDGIGGFVNTTSGFISNVIIDFDMVSSGISGLLASKSSDSIIFNCFIIGGLSAEGGQAIGAVVGASSNTYYKYVNAVTSLDTNLSSDVSGFVGISDNDEFAICRFDAQSLTRNGLKLSNQSLNHLDNDKFYKASGKQGNNFTFLHADKLDETKNFGYPYFERFDAYVKKTTVTERVNGLDVDYTYINNFSVLYKHLGENYVDGQRLRLAYNINQYGFDIKNSTIKQKEWKSVEKFIGEFDGNNKKLRGLSIGAKKFTYTVDGIQKTAVLLGFFNGVASTANFTTKISNLDLQLLEATNMTTHYEDYTACTTGNSSENLANFLKDKASRLNIATGAFAGFAQGTSTNKVQIDGVKVSFIKKNITLYGNYVGGVVGTANHTDIINCKASGFKVKGFNILYKSKNSSGFGIRYRGAYAGGICGAIESGSISNCDASVNAESDNGYDAKFIEDGGNTTSSNKISSKYSTQKLEYNNGNDDKFVINWIDAFSTSQLAIRTPRAVNSDGTNGTDATPVGGIVAYVKNCNINNCKVSSVTITTGHAGNGSNAKGYNSDNNGKGYAGGNGGNAYIGGIVGIVSNGSGYSLSGNTATSIKYDVLTDSNHKTAGGNGGNGSDGYINDVGHCPGLGCTNGVWFNHGVCSAVGNGADGGNGGNGGYTFIGNIYGSNGSSFKTSGATYSGMKCSLGGTGGKSSKGGNGYDFLTLYHYGGDSGTSGSGGNNGNGAKGSAGVKNTHSNDKPGLGADGGTSAVSTACIMQS